MIKVFKLFISVNKQTICINLSVSGTLPSLIQFQVVTVFTSQCRAVHCANSGEVWVQEREKEGGRGVKGKEGGIGEEGDKEMKTRSEGQSLPSLSKPLINQAHCT